MRSYRFSCVSTASFLASLSRKRRTPRSTSSRTGRASICLRRTYSVHDSVHEAPRPLSAQAPRLFPALRTIDLVRPFSRPDVSPQLQTSTFRALTQLWSRVFHALLTAGGSVRRPQPARPRLGLVVTPRCHRLRRELRRSGWRGGERCGHSVHDSHGPWRSGADPALSLSLSFSLSLSLSFSLSRSLSLSVTPCCLLVCAALSSVGFVSRPVSLSPRPRSAVSLIRACVPFACRVFVAVLCNECLVGLFGVCCVAVLFVCWSCRDDDEERARLTSLPSPPPPLPLPLPPPRYFGWKPSGNVFELRGGGMGLGLGGRSNGGRSYAGDGWPSGRHSQVSRLC